jgi:hypothetical protein
MSVSSYISGMLYYSDNQVFIEHRLLSTIVEDEEEVWLIEQVVTSLTFYICEIFHDKIHFNVYDSSVNLISEIQRFVHEDEYFSIIYNKNLKTTK